MNILKALDRNKLSYGKNNIFIFNVILFKLLHFFCRVYIIMEYAQNDSLFDVIRRDTYIDESRSRKWFRQLLEAIDYCHERGIVHRYKKIIMKLI